ncbi:hypothetical protein ACLKA6_016304 [Drosophila palustris]
MSGKDDRSKDNRKNMKQHKYYHKQQQQRGGGNTSSSSPQTTAVRSLVDVADSSDEPRFARKGWSSGTRSTLAPQSNRDMPTDTDDAMMEQLGVDGAPIDENARAQLRAGDYKQMSQFPSMGGGHFSFGAEKEWNNIAEGQTQLHTKAASSYFTLNLSLLNAGLQTIPFYKRMDYATSMFTRGQIVAQTEAAERAERTYQERVLRESNSNVNVNSASKSRAPSAKSVKEVLPTTTTTEAPDELDELLALTNTQLEQTSIATQLAQTLPIIPSSPTATASASKNEVEQWLDSVLDE